uniref:Uncharacterized protein n=1 Tax=Methylocapsa acidiphila TaxID=133552 RepID=Q2VNI5_METAI|nr:hypothetical protein orf111 [Methylocapsa acidiphila]
MREIGDEIVPIRFLRQAGEDHLGAGDHGLGIGEIFVQLRLVPGDAGILVGVGIAIALDRAGLAPDQAIQLRTDEILGAFADLMADLALLVVNRFAGGGVGGHGSGGGRGPSDRGDHADIFQFHIPFPSHYARGVG